MYDPASSAQPVVEDIENRQDVSSESAVLPKPTCVAAGDGLALNIRATNIVPSYVFVVARARR
jgi:hypothetical protein